MDQPRRHAPQRQRQPELFARAERGRARPNGEREVGGDTRQARGEFLRVRAHADRHLTEPAEIEGDVDPPGHARRNAFHATTAGYAADASATNAPRQPSRQPPLTTSSQGARKTASAAAPANETAVARKPRASSDV